MTETSARDAASGLPTGKRQHKPISFTAELDRASPLAPRMLDDVELQHIVISSTGNVKTPFTAQDDWDAPLAALRKAVKLDAPVAPAAK